MKIKYLILAVLMLALSVIIPFFFRDLLFILVGSLKMGWLLANVLLRLAVILLFAFALQYTLKALLKERKLKFVWVFLIALLPGFGISFIYPIYNVDFGMLGDDFKLENKAYLDQKLTQMPASDAHFSLYAFFTTTCPHCMEASERLGTNIQGGQEVAVNILFPSTEGDAQKFLADHKGGQFNYGLIESDSAFIALSGGAFPSIFLLDANGNTTNHWIGDELNYTALDYLKSLEQ